jgi:hypothetical protein
MFFQQIKEVYREYKLLKVPTPISKGWVRSLQVVVVVAAMCMLYNTHGDTDKDFMILTFFILKYRCTFYEEIQHSGVLL